MRKNGRVSHNTLSPLHKLLYNIARRFILPRYSKRSVVNLRDATLNYCLANHIKVNFPSLMISHLADCIEKKYMVGYGGLLTWIFRKFGVPLEGLQFPVSYNNKIGAKCLTNLHLKLSNKGIPEDASIEDEEEEDSDEEKDEEKEKEKEKEDQKVAKEDQDTIPTATHEKADVQERGEQEEALSEGEASKEEEGAFTDEEVRMSVKKKPIVTPRKSSRLASKGKHPVVSLDHDSSSHTTLEPQPTTPSSSKPTTPPTHHITSPPPPPIPSSPRPTTTTPTLPLSRTSQVLIFLVSLILPKFLQLF